MIWATKAAKNLLVAIVFLCNMVLIFLMLGKFAFFRSDIGSVFSLAIDLVCTPIITGLICVALFHRRRAKLSIAVSGIWLIVVVLVLHG